MPNDFYIVYETARGGGNYRTVLDTEKSIIGKDLGLEGFVYANFSIPSDDLVFLYKALIRSGVKSYCNPDLLLAADKQRWPVTWQRIVFRLNGEVYSIQFDNQVELSQNYKGVKTFTSALVAYITNTDEHKSFPPYKPPPS